MQTQLVEINNFKAKGKQKKQNCQEVNKIDSASTSMWFIFQGRVHKGWIYFCSVYSKMSERRVETRSFVSIFCTSPSGLRAVGEQSLAFLGGDEGRKEEEMRTLARSVSNHSQTEVFDLDVASGGNSTVM